MGSHTPPDHHPSNTNNQQQYCLRWNNYQNNLTNVFDQLLQAEAFVDVTLSAEGHSLKAHKVVLCACSPYFQALFFDNPCKHPIVILNGVKWTQLKALTEFMYRGEINVAHDQLAPLLKVAELLKIRGLADVSHSHSRSSSNVNANATSTTPTPSSSSVTPLPLNLLGDLMDKRPNPADFLSNSNSNHSHSGSESPYNVGNNGHHHHHQRQAHSQRHQQHQPSQRRKRRKMSTPERTPSPSDCGGGGVVDEEEMDQNEENDSLSCLAGESGGDNRDREARDMSLCGISINPINPGSTPTAADLQRVLESNAAGLGSIGPALLNLHAAAAAAAAATSGGGRSGGSATVGDSGSSSTVTNEMDIKPGIVEMIREEERAKMLESAHGWLGPGSSTLSESYQYQIQNLWQKCWNQNQGGMMHALRFRERGPLKSWRPETMAEAIFAVLREGLSLSQAARKYDIPYPTFVLYANRVHNMLGPSADGSSSSDLMSDMRPKGRGRPQRILLGSWPEEHIRGVIRAVVFRDTQSKDDIPFVFNRDGSLCIPQPSGTPTNSTTPTSSSQNGLDMSLHPHFSYSPSPSSTATATATTTTMSEGHQTQSSRHHGSTSGGGHQSHHHHNSSSSSSSSSSPLQQALSSANFNLNLQAVAQSQFLALQQHQQLHLQKLQQFQREQRRSNNSNGGSGRDTEFSPLSLLSAGALTTGSKKHASSSFSLQNFPGLLKSSGVNLDELGTGLGMMKDIMQIKAELGSYDEGDDNVDQEQDEEDGNAVDNPEDNRASQDDSQGDTYSDATDLSKMSVKKNNNTLSNHKRTDGVDDVEAVSMVQGQTDKTNDLSYETDLKPSPTTLTPFKVESTPATSPPT